MINKKIIGGQLCQVHKRYFQTYLIYKNYYYRLLWTIFGNACTQFCFVDDHSNSSSTVKQQFSRPNKENDKSNRRSTYSQGIKKVLGNCNVG